uniref:Uncharacterized protein n=1 Tax=Glossina austeni TaxID=7395 RepID=A0A1A9VYA0_GLOAU
MTSQTCYHLENVYTRGNLAHNNAIPLPWPLQPLASSSSSSSTSTSSTSFKCIYIVKLQKQKGCKGDASYKYKNHLTIFEQGILGYRNVIFRASRQGTANKKMKRNKRISLITQAIGMNFHLTELQANLYKNDSEFKPKNPPVMQWILSQRMSKPSLNYVTYEHCLALALFIVIKLLLLLLLLSPSLY